MNFIFVHAQCHQRMTCKVYNQVILSGFHTEIYLTSENLNHLVNVFLPGGINNSLFIIGVFAAINNIKRKMTNMIFEVF